MRFRNFSGAAWPGTEENSDAGQAGFSGGVAAGATDDIASIKAIGMRYGRNVVSAMEPEKERSFACGEAMHALAEASERRDGRAHMNTLAAGFALHAPSEVAFNATVTSAPHYFYGSNTHAMHEAFGVRSDDGRSLEIVDNVKLAPRVPVLPGDHISVVGELVPGADRGPLVHWTHHDPAGIHPGGYIEFNGRQYA